NPGYAGDAKNAAAAGLYVSAYAFANPYGAASNPPSNGTPQQQADYAASNAGDYKVGGQKLPMMLDIEYDPYVSSETNSNECYGLSPSAMVSWISSFLAEAKTKTGATPFVYTTRDWWDTCTGNSTAFAGDMLWIASYSSGTPGILPAGWNSWNLWQYSSAGTVSGISGATDLDYFSGGPETERTLVNTAATPIQIRTLNSLANPSGSYTYTETGLPPGTSLDSATGKITGTPSTAGTYNVTVTPSGSGTMVPSSVSFTWYVTPGTMTVTSPGNRTATAGTAVDVQLSASDSATGFGAPTFTASGLPPGLSISSSGKITGWPDAPGRYSTAVAATDSSGATASTAFTWTINAATSGPAGKVVLSNGSKCLDDPASKTANGTRPDIWTCNGGSNQKWTIAQDGSVRVLGKCLEVKGDGTANGTAIDLGTCGNGADQVWRIGTGAGLVSPQTGKCLDDPGAKTANGTQLDIWACNGGSNQKWTAPGGPAMSGVPGKCLDDKGASTANGAAVDLFTCNGAANQNWTVMPGGTVRVSGKCLEVQGNSAANDAKINLYTCNGSVSQAWTVAGTSYLGSELVNSHSGKCLADPGDTTANGTQLEIITCSSADPGMSWHLR
ncbi:MAG: ricin-type beta-trefoil lectin domain protein, partial [Streptosporangiales bacterium]|nr:ricin-type beta-trefoil lectin domain protein [Streptosporangiales bacterium]